MLYCFFQKNFIEKCCYDKEKKGSYLEKIGENIVNKKDDFIKFVKWGKENKDNKKKAINLALNAIKLLSEDDLPDSELDKIVGGMCGAVEVGVCWPAN